MKKGIVIFTLLGAVLVLCSCGSSVQVGLRITTAGEVKAIKDGGQLKVSNLDNIEADIEVAMYASPMLPARAISFVKYYSVPAGESISLSIPSNTSLIVAKASEGTEAPFN
jgi:hypothetical protein